MLDLAPSPSELAQVVNQTIAPAFILGAVSGFITVLVTRLNRIVDRCRVLTASPPEPSVQLALSRLNARAALINRALIWAVGSALTTVVLMILAFVYAFFNNAHEYGVAMLFVGALLCLGVALVLFALEIRIVINDPNNLD